MSIGRRRSWGALALGLGLGVPALAQEPPSMQERAAASAWRAPLRDAAGRVVGGRAERDGRMRVEIPGASSFDAPRYQRWIASSDGRTVAAVGDPAMPEHPFVMQLEVWRDGVRVARPRRLLDPESSITVSEDGRTAVVGHAPGERDRWFVLLLAADGQELLDQDLPRGRQGRDPVVAARSVLLRSHPLFEEGRASSILRVEAERVSRVCDASEALGLQALPGTDLVVVRGRASLRLLERETGRERWRAEHALRPVGPHAFALVAGDAGEVLAVLHTELRRRGAAEPPIHLSLLSAADGRLLERTPVARRGPVADAVLVASADGLELSWNDHEEVLWSR